MRLGRKVRKVVPVRGRRLSVLSIRSCGEDNPDRETKIDLLRYHDLRKLRQEDAHLTEDPVVHNLMKIEEISVDSLEVLDHRCLP